VLIVKALAGARAIGASSICLAGGVAANGPLRAGLKDQAGKAGFAVFVPSKSMCTDNAAMIAAAGYFNFARDGASALSLGAVPNLAFPVSSLGG